ncbi:N5-carboxyaminoimidazole ribonucleotide synthase [Companilactobacillus sp. RD055328]|uniref:5-(carboxyamino)imidazole ribonucleotide synthase n=1 Tax=Companilactobacillus sp. RD055328 TaxID=2916634 RepID=UPI001FC81ACC|nr:5-(carboxyamino)imidazole ribonucleotide synthase [Companilactobacillus sp. RD055328]GKQ42589.1 N5-carboxyaminoimidazole ribonucleotide synthase [Companilactobacillus sp. RD055328]
MTNFLKSIKPGQTIGIIGGGQLGQMMTLSAKEMNFKVIVLDPSHNCPASTVADEVIEAEYDDIEEIIKLSKRCDVLTYEFENVDVKTINKVKENTYVPQGTKALEISQNRVMEKEFLKRHNHPIADFVEIKDKTNLKKYIDEVGIPCILKTATGGYDGHGQVVINSEKDIEKASSLLASKARLILEKVVDFKMEVSVIISRNESGDTAIFPIIENQHRENILHISITPARITKEMEQLINKNAEEIATNLELVGTMGIEFFIDKNNKLYVNEIAPRPHNSGHLTIEACDFSQFDLHIKGICNMALQRPQLLKSAVMINVLGQHIDQVKDLLIQENAWHYHDYGKQESRHNRKMGHVTLLTDDVEKTIKELKETKIWNK